MKPSRLFAIIAAVVFAFSAAAHAAGKKQKKAVVEIAEGKRVVEFAPLSDVRIEMPDDSVRPFGQDFSARLETVFANHPRFIPVFTKAGQEERSKASRKFKKTDYEWEGEVLPAARVTVHIDAMSFVTGSRGGRMMYGFDERFRNDFNTGSAGNGDMVNEFPHQVPFNYPNWFDRFFDKKGRWPVDTASGLDLGDGFGLDVLFAYLSVKYATYRSEIGLRIEIDAPLAGKHEFVPLRVRGKGYFYDVAGGYGVWQGGLGIARRDAMLKAFNRAIESATKSIEDSLKGLPLTALVNAVDSSGLVFLGTGENAKIPVGTLYRAIEQPGVLLRVEAHHVSGATARAVEGSAVTLSPGMRMLEEKSGVPRPGIALGIALEKARQGLAKGLFASESVTPVILNTMLTDLPAENFEKVNLDGKVEKVSRWVAFLRSLKGAITLPYRIWRYYQYDRAYRKNADTAPDTALGLSGELLNLANAVRNSEDWARQSASRPWLRYFGSAAQGGDQGGAATVAIIDTGVDYNHPAIHDNLWMNSNPTTDLQGRQDRYGWDFISSDSRPQDDAYHGTQMASLVLAMAPRARIMPLKAFNPWGVTHSAALLSAFTYAVDHGATVILCGWGTRRDSKAIEMGVAYAREHGVRVVSAAGDLGLDASKIRTYPAALSLKYDNVIVVGALTADGSARWEKSNFGFPSMVWAPGDGVFAAEPRNTYGDVSSTGLAAALIAGLVATGGMESAPVQ